MASVILESASVRVGDTVLLEGLDLRIDDGRFVAVLGPSGSGKSTLLRALAGLAPISGGRLLFDGVDMTAEPPGRRDVAMVFQEPALLPRRSVRRNVAFPLELRNELRSSIRDRVGAEARALHIEALLDSWPSTLSRGQEQMVQMARALVRVPRLLLLDEPYSAIDEPRRRAMRADLAVLQAGYGVTTIIATNDPEDALSLASDVVVLGGSTEATPGRIVQLGPIDEVRDEPATLDVAQALGAVWTIPVRVVAADDGVWLVGVADSSFVVRSWSPRLRSMAGSEVALGVRSSRVRLAPTGAHRAVVERVVPGARPELVLGVAGSRIASSSHGGPAAPRRGEEVAFDLVDPWVFGGDGERLA